MGSSMNQVNWLLFKTGNKNLLGNGLPAGLPQWDLVAGIGWLNRTSKGYAFLTM